jgi:hypothetical protein
MRVGGRSGSIDGRIVDCILRQHRGPRRWKSVKKPVDLIVGWG